MHNFVRFLLIRCISSHAVEAGSCVEYTYHSTAVKYEEPITYPGKLYKFNVKFLTKVDVGICTSDQSMDVLSFLCKQRCSSIVPLC